MPKKKLTKTQVRKKLKQVMNASYDLVLDKMGHADSFVPMGAQKLANTLFESRTLAKKVKCRKKYIMSSSRNGLMTAEQWNNYLYAFCLHILQQKKQE